MRIPRLIRSLASEEPQPAGRQFVFVCGIARSGTSALTRLLNSHPSVCIGMERYKYLWRDKRRRERDFTPELFEEERFFDFRASDTNIIPKPRTASSLLYRDMKGKFAAATHIGDKISLSNDYRLVARRFRPATFVYILRDIREVAASFNARAEKSNPSWPENIDFRVAVDRWNTANRRTLTFARRGGDVTVVRYERLFCGDPAYLSALLRSLHLPDHPACSDAFRAITADWPERSARQREEREGQAEFIRRRADFALAEKLAAKAGLDH
jgi:hypothetical protein